MVVPNGETCNCGKQGCLETVASEWALELKASKALGRELHLNEILELAKSGDKKVLKELEEMCDYLAFGVACVVNVFTACASCLM